MAAAAPSPTSRPWWRDRGTWFLLLVTVGLRGLLLALWPDERCLRDECMYLFTADRMARGLGMTATNGWIWAPGYVALLALHQLLFGYAEVVKGFQLLWSGVSVLLLLAVGRRAVGERGARVAAWLYALSPTLAFFAVRLWSETLYAGLLLLALWALSRAREARDAGQRPWGWAGLAGLAAAACVLLRGVATYMLPLFALGLLWGRWRDRRSWLAAGLLVATAVAAVAPYSVYASRKFGGLVISDRTIGQMMWLGDNDFPPVTFDYGNGLLSNRAYNLTTARGRPHCAPKDQPLRRDACETANGLAWIRAHPGEFLRRVPLRLAQLMNPNSFLTRHLRFRGWRGLPPWGREALCWLVVAFSLLGVQGAVWGAFSSRGGPLLAVVSFATAYHLAAIAALAGLTRYRLPLDVLWLPWTGAFLASPLQALRRLASRPWRLGLALLVSLLLLGLQLWFLPAGFPRWKHW